jgi:putative transposase
VWDGLSPQAMLPRRRETRAISFQGAHVPPDIMLMGVRWEVASPVSDRHVEAVREDRGGPVAHATLQRWGVPYSPRLEEACHRRQRPVGVSGRMDEPSLKGQGQWRARAGCRSHGPDA